MLRDEVQLSTHHVSFARASHRPKSAAVTALQQLLVVLQMGRRFLGPVEGFRGILMCGLSSGFFFAMVSRTHQVGADRERP